MFRKSQGMPSPKFEPISHQRSAYEMSLSSEFQTASSDLEAAIPKAGDTCPQCRLAKIDYDSMLNLSCPDCGFTLAGCFT